MIVGVLSVPAAEIPKERSEKSDGLLAKAGGQLDRSTLLKNLNIDVTTFQRIVLTLHMCDAIEEEMLSSRKTVYTLKTAA